MEPLGKEAAMKLLIALTLAVNLLAGTAIAGAQQTSGSAPITGAEQLAIDCPPAKVQEALSAAASVMGTPAGTGTGSGLAARPSAGSPQRVEGELNDHQLKAGGFKSFRRTSPPTERENG
jgi:hypothetical protein